MRSAPGPHRPPPTRPSPRHEPPTSPTKSRPRRATAPQRSRGHHRPQQAVAPSPATRVTSTPTGKTCTTTGALTCTVTGLTNGNAYTFSVTATNATGTSPTSQASTPVTPTATAATTGGAAGGASRYRRRGTRRWQPTGASSTTAPPTSTAPRAASPSTRRSSASPPPRQARATGRWPPTAASSTTAPPASTGPRAASPSTRRSSASPPPRQARATGRWPPTGASSTTAPPTSTAPRAASPSTPRSSASPPPRQARATGRWPPTAASSTTATANFYGSMGGQPLNAADRRHRRHPDRQGLLGGGRRRRHLQLRHRQLLRLQGRQAPQRRRSSASRRPRQARATGRWPPTAGIFNYGTANFYGSKGGQPLNAPIVGFASTPLEARSMNVGRSSSRRSPHRCRCSCAVVSAGQLVAGLGSRGGCLARVPALPCAAPNSRQTRRSKLPSTPKPEGASGGTDAWWCQMPHATELPPHFVELRRGVAPLTFPYSLYIDRLRRRGQGRSDSQHRAPRSPGSELTVDFNSTVDHAPGTLTYPTAPARQEGHHLEGGDRHPRQASNDTEVVWRVSRPKGCPGTSRGWPP